MSIIKYVESKRPFAFSQTQRIASMHNGPATGETIMHFSKGVFLFGAIIALCPPAMAVTKCVKQPSSSTCSNYSSERGQSNWSATCDGVPVQGVAFCGSQDGGSIGATTTAVTTGTTDDSNKYCWCKMTSPAVSRWVFIAAQASPILCDYQCAAVCSNGVRIQSVLSAMFSNLSD